MLTHHWSFPLPRPHTGPLLGNGTLGAMVWGSENTLAITFGRADWWDHRGGKPWTAAMNFARIRSLLEGGDEAGIREIFSDAPASPGLPGRPSVLPIGRIELVFPPELTLGTAELDMATARIRICARDTGNLLATLDISPSAPVLRLVVPPDGPIPSIVQVPAWGEVGEYLASVSFLPPEVRDDGWTQRTPADAALTLRHRWTHREWRAAVSLGDDTEQILQHSFADHAPWWEAYWKRVPRIQVPGERWNFLYHYGLYKFAGLTAPQGVAATLQGPWVEDYQMPPWSNDYHFNINVQMCYWPAWQSGLWDHLQPLFTMIESWLPSLRENARLFAGIDDGYLLPHAVDDRGAIIGAFWTGTIDHACTAWIGKMMFDYWLYTGDTVFLRRLAFPFLKGAMRVYEAMMEEGADGSWHLPVSVSPEYRGAEMNAWGEDASFQLAACHWLARALGLAATALSEISDPSWQKIEERLPLASLVEKQQGPEIGLWQGLVLEESHRHHSHLAGVYPFDVLSPEDPVWQPIIARSVDHWVAGGMGLWSGWSMPWAAMLHARFGNPDATALIIDIWERLFTNEGHGTLHDVAFRGISLMGQPGMQARPREIMQMDAGMAITAAIMDALVHVRAGVVHLFPGIPDRWADCSFDGLYVEGGFRISARRETGKLSELTITANQAGHIVMKNPWEPTAAEPLLTWSFAAGESRVLHPSEKPL